MYCAECYSPPRRRAPTFAKATAGKRRERTVISVSGLYTDCNMSRHSRKPTRSNVLMRGCQLSFGLPSVQDLPHSGLSVAPNITTEYQKPGQNLVEGARQQQAAGHQPRDQPGAAHFVCTAARRRIGDEPENEYETENQCDCRANVDTGFGSLRRQKACQQHSKCDRGQHEPAQ